MNKENIAALQKVGVLRPKQMDKEKAKSLLYSAITNVEVVKTIAINEKSATLIFREAYESIRQLGDIKWWTLNYETDNHDISLDALKDMDIKERVILNHLDRFRKIRHDANYRGFRVSEAQAKEILEFWDRAGKEIIEVLRKAL